MIAIELLHQLVDPLRLRRVLDDTQRLFKIGQGDLALVVDLDHLEGAADLVVVLLELGVDLGDHGADLLVERGGHGVRLVRVGFRILRRSKGKKSGGQEEKRKARGKIRQQT
jgi:hypothetical protein